MSSHKSSQSTNPSAAAQLGSKGGKVGGKNRARKLSGQQRSDIAKKGAIAKNRKLK